MSHRASKRIRREMRGFFGRDIDLERAYMRSLQSEYTAINAVGSDRAIYQMAKRNVNRDKNGLEPVQPMTGENIENVRRYLYRVRSGR